MTRPIVVVKVGGSLLDWPELPERLAAYLDSRPDVRLVLIVGGGPFADVLRQLDSTFAIGERSSHALALRVLDLTAQVLARLIPGTRIVEAVEDLDVAWASTDVPVLAPRRFLEGDDASADPLPHSWTTTTDAIAARLAHRLGAEELVLLKSVDLPIGATLIEAARLGIVDAEFPRAVEGLPSLRFENFRRSGPSLLIGTGHPPTGSGRLSGLRDQPPQA